MKKVLSVIIAVVFAIALSTCALAQDTNRAWPNSKTVEITCPASAGGATDNAARIWANSMSAAFPGTNFIVNNDNTGNGTVAMEKIRNSKALDGSELLFYNTGMLLANYTGAYQYKLLDDFQFVTIGYSTNPDGFMLCVAGNSSYNTAADLIEDIKSHPGARITGVQNGSTRQFLAGAMKAATGTDFKNVDTGSESDTIIALLGGNIQFAFVQAANAIQYEQTGDMKILGICQPERSSNYPDVPTMDEQGFPGMNLNALQIIAGPKDMPVEIAEAIAEAMQEYAQDETVINALSNMKVDYTYTDRNTCVELVKETDAIFGEAAKSLGY